ncbi:hypothetical protein [Microbacterium sp. SSM24]|uniref:hypothetical protein n=1 Tax=Microbacterium sp. SSM24 TaxID=2991714 RepID=UPI00222799CD|nr:hypothetical protein [Microbacterium sp. SSM24]MCW3493508.1 hypothetical protein [Microbacterium sp. SSM24]
MKMKSKLLVGALAISALLTFTSTGPAHATEADTVSATEVAEALSNVEASLVESAAESSTTSASAAVVTGAGTQTSIPREPEDDVRLMMGSTSISIGLPAAGAASPAVTLESGVVAYPSRDAAATTVVPLNDGVQILTTIASEDASTSFAYPLSIPGGGSVSLGSDGSAMVQDAAGVPLIITTAPWAVDAAGSAVPTHYEVKGTELVQVVDHTTGDYEYPIVADPTYTYWWGGKTWVPAKAVSVQQVAVMLAGFIAVPPAAIVSAGLGICNQAGRGIWIYWTWAGHVWCTGP